ncbi:hypothetical protein ACPXB3_21530 [Gordonia sp. DT219]|uniref:hypothetical protein n=1 Tax=Gordonia sp. DT219 TaxID=3416658 RepID=UPI003CEB0EA3
MSVDPASLLRSLAQRLDDLGFAMWEESGAYPKSPGRPVVTVGKLPQNIVSAIALNHYFTDPDVDTVADNPLHYVQLRFREPGPTPLTVIDREQETFRLLQSTASGVWPGGVSPDTVTLSSAAPADPEDGAWTKTANYAIRLNP